MGIDLWRRLCVLLRIWHPPPRCWKNTIFSVLSVDFSESECSEFSTLGLCCCSTSKLTIAGNFEQWEESKLRISGLIGVRVGNSKSECQLSWYPGSMQLMYDRVVLVLIFFVLSSEKSFFCSPLFYKSIFYKSIDRCTVYDDSRALFENTILYPPQRPKQGVDFQPLVKSPKIKLTETSYILVQFILSTFGSESRKSEEWCQMEIDALPTTDNIIYKL